MWFVLKSSHNVWFVFRNANDDEIKRAYKKRALIHHPDRHASATENEKKEQEKKFKEVGEAYGILSDPKKKARYDNGQDMDDFDGGMSGKSNKNLEFICMFIRSFVYFSDIDPSQVFQSFFSGGHGQSFGFGNNFPGEFTFQFG